MASIRTAAFAMVMAGAATLASATPPSAPGNRPYLALGDSVPFGAILPIGFPYVNAKNFIGYPDWVGGDLRLDTTNAACPGETSASFMSPTGADNGCRAIRARPFPLHVSYPSTQQAFAESFLTTHKQTQLVTISLGSNDLVLLVLSCNFDATCINAGLDTLTLNMGKILQDLRGRFRGVLMVVNYYSPDTSETPLIQLLNGRLAKAASENGAVLADVFTAFGGISGNPCETGLLNVKPETPPPQMFQPLCDVHPSQSGHQLIADTIEATYKAAIPGH